MSFILITQLDLKGKKKRALVHTDYIPVILEMDQDKTDIQYGDGYWANAEERFQSILNGLEKEKLVIRPKDLRKGEKKEEPKKLVAIEGEGIPDPNKPVTPAIDLEIIKS